MGKYTLKRSQRCDGSNAQGGGSKRRRKSQEKYEEKKVSVWRPTGAQGPHWGARTELRIRPVQLEPRGRHLGPILQQKFRLTNLGFLHPI